MPSIYTSEGQSPDALRRLLDMFPKTFNNGDRIGIKLHWGERGNENFIRPMYAREIVRWLKEKGANPYVFDTTVLYSGGRRNGADSLKTAAEHGFTEEFLGCPVLIGDGLDGRDVIDIPSVGRHFDTVQVVGIMEKTDGFVVFSHFKGHMEASFGGSIKNVSMGMASRAQKQRMHSDAHPVLIEKRCIRCGICREVCPVGAVTMEEDRFPAYDLDVCIGCAQCIAHCPQTALKIFWETDISVFQEKLVETAASVWKRIGPQSIVINALIQIVSECDCMAGNHPPLSGDYGFVGGYNPAVVDEESMNIVGADKFDAAHPGIPWRRQFSYAREIGLFA
jgi:uncharacterized Fe-S center protein